MWPISYTYCLWCNTNHSFYFLVMTLTDAIVVPGVVTWMVFFFFFFLSFFLFIAAPVTYGHSRARSQIRATAAVCAIATAILDLNLICDLCHSLWHCQSLTHWARPGIEFASLQGQCVVLNLWGHSGYSHTNHILKYRILQLVLMMKTVIRNWML